MLLLVGLGNPTPNSQNNRHNIGFKVVDAINQKFGLSKQKPKFKGLLTTGNIGDKKIYVIKPLTFMNSSGICIRELLEYFKIESENVKDYSRVRIGIGKPQNKRSVSDFVLNDFNDDEQELLKKITNNIIESLAILIDKKLDLFSSTVNNN